MGRNSWNLSGYRRHYPQYPQKKICDVLNINRTSHSHHFIQRVITFTLVCFGWIFFRANSLSDAKGIINSIFTCLNPWILTDGSLYKIGLDHNQLFVLIISAAILFAVSSFHHYGIRLRTKILKSNVYTRWAVVFAMIFVILIFGIYGPGYDESQFIYFQF